MRLMLGYNKEPYLLVSTSIKETCNKFKFYVINGNWDGLFNNGTITVFRDNRIIGHAFGCYVLSDVQNLLQGNDYNEVFLRFKYE